MQDSIIITGARENNGACTTCTGLGFFQKAEKTSYTGQYLKHLLEVKH